MVGLGDLVGGNFYSTANDVSADGSTVVGKSSVGYTSGPSPEPIYEAFVWDSANGMRELDDTLTGLGLNLTGWSLDEATGISADGNTIVGWGMNPNGQREAWLATVPEPGTALPETIVVLGIAASRRRRAS